MNLPARSILIVFLLVLLGCQCSEEPSELLVIASGYVSAGRGSREHPAEPSDDVRHKAVRELLALQSKRFNVNLPPVPTKDTTGIDHVLVTTLQHSNGTVRLVATPSLRPNIGETEDDYYWSMEELTFAVDGKLLSRRPYKE
jgi:broad specificity polyphosphatase/5'/3'-nucleotidase SurE